MTKATSNTSSWRTALIGYRYFIVGALAFALYVNTLGHDFTLDDAIVIYDNDFTKTGFSGIPELLQFDTFRGFFKVEGKENLVAGGRYRPLTLIMFAMEYQIFGNSPWAFHLISVLLYSLLCVVLLYFLETLFQEKKTFWILAAVLIFVTHPIHTEVVANIKGRDEILSLLFGMCALTSLLNKKIIWTILFSFLACMSKEMAVTWLPISILSLLIIRRYSLIDSIKSTWPLASGIGLYLVLRFSVLGFTTTSEPITEMLNNPFIKLVGSQYLPFSFGEWTSSIFLSLGKYIKLLCFPLTLTHDYYPRHLEVSNWSNWGSILSLIIYSSLTFLAFYWHKIKPKMSYSIAFYMVSLVLISNIIFPIGTHMGERFIFMASVGFSLFSALCLERYFPSKVFGIILALILVLFSMKTITRNSAWKNDKTLFLTDVRVSSNSAKCNNAVGGAIIDECLQQGGVDCNISDIDMAMKHLKKAIAIHPNYKTAHLILGNAYFIKKQYDDAILSYKNALGIDFSLQDAQKNLMLTYIAVAKEYGEKRGNPNKAIEYLKEAFTLDDSNIEVLRLLGIAFGIKGEYNQAIKYFKQIVLLDPSNAAAYLNLGISYNHLGENKIGQEYINKAQSLDPTILKK